MIINLPPGGGADILIVHAGLFGMYFRYCTEFTYIGKTNI